MDELVEWLRGVLADDEDAARKCLDINVQAAMIRGETPPRWEYQPDGKIVSGDGGPSPVTRAFTWPTEAAHIIRHDPAQVLADIEAKRALLELHANGYPGIDYCVSCYENHDAAPWPCPTLRALASGYRHRPGWKPEWEA